MTLVLSYRIVRELCGSVEMRLAGEVSSFTGQQPRTLGFFFPLCRPLLVSSRASVLLVLLRKFVHCLVIHFFCFNFCAFWSFICLPWVCYMHTSCIVLICIFKNRVLVNFAWKCISFVLKLISITADSEAENGNTCPGFWEELPCGIYSITIEALDNDGFLASEVRKHEWTDSLVDELIKWERTSVEPNPEELQISRCKSVSVQHRFQSANPDVAVSESGQWCHYAILRLKNGIL